MPNRTLGGDWRENLGLERNPSKDGPLYDIPDWSYADGRPGIPSFKEVTRMVEMKQYAIQIKEALDLIKFSENAVKSKDMEEENAKNTYAKSKLKSKGNRTFSDLL